MVVVRERKPPLFYRQSRAVRRLAVDRLFMVGMTVAVAGLLIFQASSLYSRSVLERVNAGGGNFDLAPGVTGTAYFSVMHGERAHLIFQMPAGTGITYTIYIYNMVDTIYGQRMFQYPVQSGSGAGSVVNVYMPGSYVDATYFVNFTVARPGPSALPMSVSVTAYSEFYMVQPFQYQAEIAGLILLAAGVIVVAARLSSYEPVF